MAVVVLLCLSFAVSVSRAEYVVGVKSGDWIRYDITISYLGQSVKGSIKITVQSVQGVYVNLTYEVSVQGQTLTPPEQFILDVSTGSGGSASGFIIPANLTVGQPIPGEAANVQTIADWRGRHAIVANATSPFMPFEARVYWDQATGVLLETTGSISGTDYSTDYSISVVETSLWGGGLFGLDWMIWVIIIAVVVAVVVVIVGLMMRRRRVQTVPPLSQEGQPPPPPPPPPPA